MAGPTLRAARGSVRRLFGLYAAVSLVPIVLLGLLLVSVLHAHDDARGLAVGRDEAGLIARTSFAPLLGDRPVSTALPPAEQAALRLAVVSAVRSHATLRMRLRDLTGRIVLASDGAHATTGPADDEALEAAHGETNSSLTRLNADAGDTGDVGPRVVEVYEPLLGVTGRRLGVLELYLPYAPIAAEQASQQRIITLTLGGGLVVLWLCLLAVSFSLSRRLRRHAETNAYLADHDALTGLPNRARFTEVAEDAIDGATAERPVAIALIDLDGFKDINDSLGHHTGDLLLTQLARRLSDHTGAGDLVARLGGDEFGIVLRDTSGAEEALRTLGRLRSALRIPFLVDGLPLAVDASCGVTLAPEDGTDKDVLLLRADLAMYAAKRMHLGVVRYHPDHDPHDGSALTLVAELDDAIADDQLVLHYQPKGDIDGAAITAVEALVRWQHPSRGLLYPDAFLRAVEQTALIDDLTRWVLRTALGDLRDLDPDGELSVAVNASARSLMATDFADHILAVLRETRMDPGRLILEVTETALLADPARAATTLGRLHEAGVRVSIDDFGAGHTSLGYLAMLPISELKIDKGFVLAMAEDARQDAIVRSVIELGHSLGFSVTAEGVETPELLERLVAYRCDTAQGYLLSRPVPLPLLRAHIDAARVALRGVVGARRRPVRRAAPTLAQLHARTAADAR